MLKTERMKQSQIRRISMLEYPSPLSNHEKNRWKAACFSLLFPGLGQAYRQHWTKAVFFISAYAILRIVYYYSIIPLLSKGFFSPMLICSLVIFALSIAAALDAAAFFDKLPLNSSASATNHKDPWLAMFLSLIFPGLGHAYVKKWYWAIPFLLLYCWLLYLDWHVLFRTIFKLATAIHVYTTLTGRSCLKALSSFLLVAMLISILVYIDIPELSAKQFFPITIGTGPSMEPTIKEGDLAIENKLAYIFGSPERGDIVSIRLSNVPGTKYSDSGLPFYIAKRVVAVNGDDVTIANDGLYINNQVVKKWNLRSHTYTYATDIPDPNETDIPMPLKTVVPLHSVFVIGDNLDHSYDSRDFGTIPIDKVNGKIVKIFPNKLLENK